MELRNRVILVTGSPRSGTTAIGKILASAPGTYYAREPMNRWSGDRVIQHAFGIPGTGSFSYEACSDLVERIGALKLRWKVGITPQDRDLMFIKRNLMFIKRALVSEGCRIHMRCTRLQPKFDTVIWKDPFAALCIPWILDNTDIPVVVTVRPIEAVAASYKRLSWKIKFREILPRVEQAGLIDSAEGLRDFDLGDPVVMGAMIWCLIYESSIARISSFTQYKNKLIMCDTDKIISDPLIEFQSIFDKLKLPFDEKIKKIIENKYSQENYKFKVTPRSVPYDNRRNLNQINSYWTKVLDTSDIEIIERVKHAWMSSNRYSS